VSDPILEVRALLKSYATVTAVDGVSFAVNEGICFGLLGPNGAGKTTTIEIMEGILSASSGEVRYRGEPLGRRSREDSGILFQKTALQDFLTVRQSLTLFSESLCARPFRRRAHQAVRARETTESRHPQALGRAATAAAVGDRTGE